MTTRTSFTTFLLALALDYKIKFQEQFCLGAFYLRCNPSNSLPWTGATVKLGHNHGVADGHQDNGDEEHDNVDKEVVDPLDHLDLDHLVGVEVALKTRREDLVTRSLHQHVRLLNL